MFIIIEFVFNPYSNRILKSIIFITLLKICSYLHRLLTATVAWPFPVIIYVGIILSTLGAALQSLTGAPRLLAAIANDDILPVLNYFKVADGGEPYIATLFTAFICLGCVVIGNLDLISPTITMFYLLCYAGVNLSCFLLDLLDAPSWRPRWKFHHWSLSLIGATICIGMIIFIIIYCSHNLASFGNCSSEKVDGYGTGTFLKQKAPRLHEMVLWGTNVS